MAPSNSSSAASPSSLVVSLRRSAPPAANWPADEEYRYHCKFCGKGSNNHNAISGHYNLHRRESRDTYLRLGPAGSKVRRGILQARNEAREYEYKKMGWARAGAGSLSPEPVRAILPPRAPPQLPLIGPMGRAGFSTARAPLSLSRGLWEPVILKETGPVARAQGPVGFLMSKGDVAGPSSSAGSEAAVDFSPPPGFGRIIPDLNSPASSNKRPAVKREIIITD